MVYRAYDPVIGRRVAIKLVRADLLEGKEREAFLARFHQEAQTAGRCMHPNIVMIHDFATHDGNPFLAMEYVEGASLASVLAQIGRFPAKHAIGIALQTLSALEAAHALGIVHRDVKPANILMLSDGRVKVTDFGIARMESGAVTQSGVLIGTPSYMSPEQYRGDVVDARSDLFSAGAVLFELLTGERPFPGRNVVEVGAMLIDPAPINLAVPLADQPAELIAALGRMLAKRPGDRFASASEAITALRSLQPKLEGTEGSATIVRQPRRPRSDSAVFDSAVLSQIEQHLAVYVGPIARHLIRDASQQATTLDSLCSTLEMHISQAVERAAFRRAVFRSSSPLDSLNRPTEMAVGSVPALLPTVIERVERDLAQFLGPIARILVRRAAAEATSEVALRQALAEHIAKPNERSDFLARGGRGK